MYPRFPGVSNIFKNVSETPHRENPIDSFNRFDKMLIQRYIIL